MYFLVFLHLGVNLDILELLGCIKCSSAQIDGDKLLPKDAGPIYATVAVI